MRLPAPRRTDAPARPREPVIDVDTGRTFNGVAVRALLALVATGFARVALELVGGTPEVLWAVAATAGAAVTLFCAPPGPQILLVAGGLALLNGDAPFDPLALALVALGHLTTRLAWWSAHVPPSARAELRATVPDLRRFATIQGVVQVAGVGLLVLAGTDGAPVGVALGGVALAALTVLVLPRR
ncbi:hypothetical protein [Cellulosimicrobium marinum]|uniref:hypothetical protein n=1 Tax=Cellulosimicrobium marinum TaxID=1638992 RepID=UPI001E4A602C|nr:hypothetical protein [Cellulosimicrobium marinum]MCB7137502.1 hypothetical protein [Cellulosimicrobium marinum]